MLRQNGHYRRDRLMQFPTRMVSGWCVTRTKTKLRNMPISAYINRTIMHPAISQPSYTTTTHSPCNPPTPAPRDSRPITAAPGRPRRPFRRCSARPEVSPETKPRGRDTQDKQADKTGRTGKGTQGTQGREAGRGRGWLYICTGRCGRCCCWPVFLLCSRAFGGCLCLLFN